MNKKIPTKKSTTSFKIIELDIRGKGSKIQITDQHDHYHYSIHKRGKPPESDY